MHPTKRPPVFNRELTARKNLLIQRELLIFCKTPIASQSDDKASNGSRRMLPINRTRRASGGRCPRKKSSSSGFAFFLLRKSSSSSASKRNGFSHSDIDGNSSNSFTCLLINEFGLHRRRSRNRRGRRGIGPAVPGTIKKSSTIYSSSFFGLCNYCES